MTKSRKRMLLSSVAMLLVALVALGSATYAWFTINKTVTADTMKVQAIAADGLVIANKKSVTATGTGDWAAKVSFTDQATPIQPISYAVAVGSAMPNGYIAQDVKRTGGGAWATGNTDISAFKEITTLPNNTWTDSTYRFNANDNVAHYQVLVANSGTTAMANNLDVEISAAGTANKKGIDYAKAALVYDGKVIAWYSHGTSETTYNAITGTTPSVTALSDTGSPEATDILGATPSIPAKGTTGLTFDLYVWYEGNDPDCTDANQVDSDVAFTLSFTLAD